ncbi:putative transposase orfA for insertion sequence element [Clostridium botulinum CFSAN001627]|uniref:Putative transposase orfA for insertion sequence element n=1 Tax=Clostridium botulinum CFSAN001627 TaxID=1232189 RepID=M1ZW71_CLOBO|nr:putative transposase orfA for insertion sequence element [Clostridium botulinum CFSAN001627]
MKEHGFDGRCSVVKYFVRVKKEQLDEKVTVQFETMLGL